MSPKALSNHGNDSMNDSFSVTAPLDPTLQKVIAEEQRLHATLPAQGNVAWKSPAAKHSQKEL